MIYDYYNGCFVEKLEIGNLYNESNKNYHLQITDSENLNITFRGKHLYDGHDATVIAYPSTTTLMAAKQYFRLGVQYLMYLVRNEPPQPYIFDRMNRFRGNEVLNVLKTKIITLKSSITTFMEENELLDDEFMKELLKDLNVMKNVQGNTNQYMYLTARENAQGRETSYNMNSQFDESETIVNNDSSPPQLERASAGVYATPGRLTMMREVSDSSRTPNII
jgi:regulator of replication initiation timing